MKPRSFIRAAVMVAAFALAIPAFAAESIGVVGALQGSASAAGASGARALKVGDKVFLDEEVTTQPGSKLQLMLNDRSTITLNPNSKVKVREFAFDAHQESGSMAMESVKGAFRFIGGALSKQNPVTIKTPVSSIGIRGGIADTHVGPNGETNAIFLYGDAMTMTNQNGQTTEVTLPGQGLSMQTPNDVPTFTPPQVVQQLLGAFEPSSNGAAPGSTTEAPTDTTAPEATNGETSQQEGSTADTQQSNDTRTPEQKAKDQQQFGALGSGQVAPATTNTLPLNHTFDQSKPNPELIANQATTTASTTANGSAAGGTTINNNAEFRGRYGDTEAQSGTTIRERGAVAAVRNGSDLLLSANEFAPNSGATHYGKIPLVSTAGYSLLGTAFRLDTTSPEYTGFAYASPGLDGFYYHLDEVGGSGDMNMFIGRQIAPTSVQQAMTNSSAWSNTTPGGHTGSVNYYRFAPDLLAYTGANGTPLGFFDYGIKDINTSITGDNGRTADFGMAVDWANKRFLSGYIHWENSAGASRDFVAAFGKVGGTGANDPAMGGAAFDFRQNGTTISSMDSRLGSINSPAGTLYGNANNEIESLMVEGTAPDGHSIVTPAMRVTGVTTVNENRIAGVNTMKGFAAGHYVQGVNGTPSVKTIWNTHSNGVTVTTNNDTSNVTGSINLFEKDTPTNTVDASFGTATNSQSAYLSKDLYASQQAGLSYGGATTGSYASNNGFIANGQALANSNVTGCSTCAFAHWGVWAGEVNRGSTEAPVVDSYVVPYVAGQVTQNMDTNVVPLALGTVTYDGAMIGSEHNPATGTLQRHEGTFSADIDLDNRSLVGFSGSIGSFTAISLNGGPAAIPGTGPANFTFGIEDTGTGALGTANGALFGPAADNVAGNYGLAQGSGDLISGTGVFLGDR